jgi:hypothetical protein
MLLRVIRFAVLFVSSMILMAFSGVSTAGPLAPDTHHTWGISNTFVTGGGWIQILWSGNYYRHRAHTSGYSRNNGGGATPVQVRAQTRSYELSNVHPSPCNDRWSSLAISYGEVDAYTSSASVFPCGGSPGNGWHYYYGHGYHWVGSYFGYTWIQL